MPNVSGTVSPASPSAGQYVHRAEGSTVQTPQRNGSPATVHGLGGRHQAASHGTGANPVRNAHLGGTNQAQFAQQAQAHANTQAHAQQFAQMPAAMPMPNAYAQNAHYGAYNVAGQSTAYPSTGYSDVNPGKGPGFLARLASKFLYGIAQSLYARADKKEAKALAQNQANAFGYQQPASWPQTYQQQTSNWSPYTFNPAQYHQQRAAEMHTQLQMIDQQHQMWGQMHGPQAAAEFKRLNQPAYDQMHEVAQSHLQAGQQYQTQQMQAQQQATQYQNYQSPYIGSNGSNNVHHGGNNSTTQTENATATQQNHGVQNEGAASGNLHGGAGYAANPFAHVPTHSTAPAFRDDDMESVESDEVMYTPPETPPEPSLEDKADFLQNELLSFAEQMSSIPDGTAQSHTAKVVAKSMQQELAALNKSIERQNSLRRDPVKSNGRRQVTVADSSSGTASPRSTPMRQASQSYSPDFANELSRQMVAYAKLSSSGKASSSAAAKSKHQPTVEDFPEVPEPQMPSFEERAARTSESIPRAKDGSMRSAILGEVPAGYEPDVQPAKGTTILPETVRNTRKPIFST